MGTSFADEECSASNWFQAGFRGDLAIWLFALRPLRRRIEATLRLWRLAIPYSRFAPEAVLTST